MNCFKVKAYGFRDNLIILLSFHHYRNGACFFVYKEIGLVLKALEDGIKILELVAELEGESVVEESLSKDGTEGDKTKAKGLLFEQDLKGIFSVFV